MLLCLSVHIDGRMFRLNRLPDIIWRRSCAAVDGPGGAERRPVVAAETPEPISTPYRFTVTSFFFDEGIFPRHVKGVEQGSGNKSADGSGTPLAIHKYTWRWFLLRLLFFFFLEKNAYTMDAFFLCSGISFHSRY